MPHHGGVTIVEGTAEATGRSREGARQADGARRAELAAFLRERRARIAPQAVGLPPGLRRRTPGLRREEVAQLAGVGVTWYTWLEQGRPINASDQVLAAIARTLRLDPAEQAYLYQLAGVPIPRDEFGSTLEPEIQVVLDQMARLPAVVCSPRYDLLRWNAAYATLFPCVACSGRRNLLWGAFTLQQCCNPYIDPERELGRLVAFFRAGYARHVGEPAWESLIAELAGASPQFAAMWAQHEVAAATTSRVRGFRHPVRGEFNVVVTYLTIPSTPEAWVSVYTAADDESRATMEWLLDNPEQARPDHTH